MSNLTLATEVLRDKVALITGASSGIGAQQARALGAAGAKLVLVARNELRLQCLQEELQAQDIAVAYLATDLLQEHNWPIVAEQGKACFGKVDILANTAGINLRQPAAAISSSSWDTTLTLNTKVPFMLAQLLVPEMASRGWGRIINIASLQSTRAFANGLAYGASKGAVVQLTRSMAQAWSGSGINCNAIAPGFFPTELTQPVFNDETLAAELAQQTAIGRNGKLDDLNGISVFLASDACAYITGQIIYVDGGFTAL